MLSISASVGKYGGGTVQCYNLPNDQRTVVELLNKIGMTDGGQAGLLSSTPTDLRWGEASPQLHHAILRFQEAQKLSVDGHVDPGDRTLARLNALAFPDTPDVDPLRDPNEARRIRRLLDEQRPGVRPMIESSLTSLGKLRKAWAVFNEDPGLTLRTELEERFAVDGLDHYFRVSKANWDKYLDKIIATFDSYLSKVGSLAANQHPADYATLLTKFPEELAKDGQLTTDTPPAFSDPQLGMHFTPRYRRFDQKMPPLFAGFFPERLRGIQLHEMGHFYFGFDDGDPRGQAPEVAMKFAQSYDLLASEIVFKRRFA